MAKRLPILHLSDLHMGQERRAGRWRLRDVLGDAWRDNLDAIAQDRQVDLMCFTGDLAFSGKPEQYREAGEAIEFLLQTLKLDKARFFRVQGNHDSDRDLEEDAWRQLRDANDVRPEDFDPCIAGGRAPCGCDNARIDAVLLRPGDETAAPPWNGLTSQSGSGSPLSR
jgi:DNA repair exonuclease SbcCD nuclease subunit